MRVGAEVVNKETAIGRSLALGEERMRRTHSSRSDAGLATSMGSEQGTSGVEGAADGVAPDIGDTRPAVNATEGTVDRSVDLQHSSGAPAAGEGEGPVGAEETQTTTAASRADRHTGKQISGVQLSRQTDRQGRQTDKKATILAECR